MAGSNASADRRAIALDDWLEIADREYIQAYVIDGGATVKVVVAEENATKELATGIIGRAKQAGFVTAIVDSSSCKVHLIHNLWYSVAQQVDWATLAREFVRQGLAERGYPVPPSEVLDLQDVADHHGLELALMRRQLNQMLSTRLYQNHDLTREMRLATVQLCLAAAEGTDQAVLMGQSIHEWLCGDLRLVGALKQALIFRKINRHNARGLLSSLGSWVRLAGRSGFVAVVDITRYLDLAPDPNQGLRFTRTAALEVYEVIRQFIDGTDKMVSTLLVFITDPSFLVDAPRDLIRSGLGGIDFDDDVRDRRQANPLSSMVAIR
jgi:hypothetical protein